MGTVLYSVVLTGPNTKPLTLIHGQVSLVDIDDIGNLARAF